MKKILEIALKSDLCVASGDGYSSAIDTDVCYDQYGFPIIPARRIKGCMLEAAHYLELEREIIDRLFGITGDESSGSLHISTAKIKGIGSAITSDMPNPSLITNLFTMTRTSTKLDDSGCAEENSLRSLRVVSHYSPLDKQDLVFEAAVEFTENDYNNIEKIVKALRNLGYKRNRGFGAVKCSLRNATDSKATESFSLDPATNYTLNYRIRLEDTVMLPGDKSNISADYIPGTSVFGFFAGKLSSDKNFADIFLRGKVIFSNLYPYIKDSSTIPVPFTICKDKLTNSLVNGLTYKGENAIKPVKKGFIAEDRSLVEPAKETVYHNGKLGSEDQTLYTQTCLASGQEFAGEISGQGNYLQKIFAIMRENQLRFGRSKTAQYSTCSLVGEPIIEKIAENEDLKPATEIGMAVLESDLILFDQYGNSTLELAELSQALGFDYANINLEDSVLKPKIIKGFNAKWRLLKPPIRAFAAGSVVVLKKTVRVRATKINIGEKINEGFGRIGFYAVDYFDLKPEKQESAKIPDQQLESPDNPLSALLERREARKQIQKQALEAGKELANNSVITSSYAGRIILMAKQAIDCDDFNRRVESVKTENKRKAVEELMEQYEEINKGDYWRSFYLTTFTILKYLRRGTE